MKIKDRMGNVMDRDYVRVTLETPSYVGENYTLYVEKEKLKELQEVLKHCIFGRRLEVELDTKVINNDAL